MATPGTNKRILNEVAKLQAMAGNTDSSSVRFVLERSPVDNPGSSTILGKIYPNSPVFNQAAFQIELKLPAEYPFKAPEARFITPIYHPNVGDEGKICIEILNSTEGFKPTTSLVDIVKAIVERIDNPNLDHALKPDIAAEYTSSRSAFDRKAQDMVKKHGLSRN